MAETEVTNIWDEENQRYYISMNDEGPEVQLELDCKDKVLAGEVDLNVNFRTTGFKSSWTKYLSNSSYRTFSSEFINSDSSTSVDKGKGHKITVNFKTIQDDIIEGPGMVYGSGDSPQRSWTVSKYSGTNNVLAHIYPFSTSAENSDIIECSSGQTTLYIQNEGYNYLNAYVITYPNMIVYDGWTNEKLFTNSDNGVALYIYTKWVGNKLYYHLAEIEKNATVGYLVQDKGCLYTTSVKIVRQGGMSNYFYMIKVSTLLNGSPII